MLDWDQYKKSTWKLNDSTDIGHLTTLLSEQFSESPQNIFAIQQQLLHKLQRVGFNTITCLEEGSQEAIPYAPIHRFGSMGYTVLELGEHSDTHGCYLHFPNNEHDYFTVAGFSDEVLPRDYYEKAVLSAMCKKLGITIRDATDRLVDAVHINTNDPSRIITEHRIYPATVSLEDLKVLNKIPYPQKAAKHFERYQTERDKIIDEEAGKIAALIRVTFGSIEIF